MILAGDIGGTKTDLAIFDSHDSQMSGAKFERSYLNREQENLPAMVHLIFAQVRAYSAAASSRIRFVKSNQ